MTKDLPDKIHTTKMGVERIKKNLKLGEIDVVEFCKNKILDKNCKIYKRGKNLYCEIDDIKITINSHSYTIITAHKIKQPPLAISQKTKICRKNK